MIAALESTSDFFAERHAHARQRQEVIAANPSLQERELIKLASLATAMAGALRRRGVTEPAASLAAETGVAVFKVAFERWINDARERDLAQSSGNHSTNCGPSLRSRVPARRSAERA